MLVKTNHFLRKIFFEKWCFSTFVRNRIDVNNLKFYVCHGVYEYEKVEPQTFLVNLSLFPKTQCGVYDDISNTVDYTEVTRLTASIMEGPSCDLIEYLAHQIAEKILQKFGTVVPEVQVQIEKLQPKIEKENGGVV